MYSLRSLVGRNVKLYFKDKGMFFTSLITPVILLVLYAAFLSDVFRDTFRANLGALQLEQGLIDGLVAGQVTSSILAVSCVTVAFCSNFLMVQDKAGGALRDLRMCPVSAPVLSLSYFLASLLSTLIVCAVGLGLCLGYTALAGWYLSAADVLCLGLDILLLVLFGTALSSLINSFLSTQGQISAVGTVVSSGYGFICGAYMPISSFGGGLRAVLSFLPGTYGTALVRNHAMGGVLRQMTAQGIPDTVVEELRTTLDCRLYFMDMPVSQGAMYLILGGAIALLIGIFVLVQRRRR